MSNIEKEPFTPQRLEEERAEDKRIKLTVSLNQEEQAILKECKKRIHQAKDSTALKQLAFIGAKDIQRPEITEILDVLFNNDRKNERLGIHDFE